MINLVISAGDSLILPRPDLHAGPAKNKVPKEKENDGRHSWGQDREERPQQRTNPLSTR